MAIADIVSVTGTIVTGQGEAGNVTAFDGATFLNTIKQDASFVAFADALTNLTMFGIYFIWDNPWEVNIVFSDYEHTYTITTNSGPYTLAQLGVTANIINGGFDAIELTVEYPAYEFPDMFYTMSSDNSIVTTFDVDTFVDALNQDTNLTDYYKNSGSPTLVGLEIYSGGDGTWDISFTNSNGTWCDKWYDESGSYTLAQLGITADLTKKGYDLIYLAPDDGYTLPPLLGVFSSGNEVITAFDADTFIATMSRDAYVVDLVRYFGSNFSSIFFENDEGEWDFEIAFDNDRDYFFNSSNSPYTLAQLGITTDLSESGFGLIYLVRKEAGITSAKAYGTVSGASKRVHKLYGSVNGESVEIKKLYGSVNGESKLIYKAMPYYPATAYGVVYYKPDARESTVCSVVLQSQEEFDSLCNFGFDGWAAVLGNGSVIVKSNDTTNVIVGVDIGQNITVIKSGFLHGCSGLSRPLTIPNNVVTIGSNFLDSCTSFNQSLTISSSITKIPSSFLYRCLSFNQPLTIPNNVTAIEDYFLQGCTGFNQSITLSSNLTRIGSDFLNGCTSFNQPLSLPSSLTSSNSIGINFMYNCKNMVSAVDVGSIDPGVPSRSDRTFATTDSNAACYTTGILLTGAQKGNWKIRYPDRTSSPYRKLRVGG